MNEYNILLDPKKMPDAWYNINADMPTPMAPVLHPGTQQPVKAEDLAAIFPMGLIAQEMSAERYISIPGEVMDKLLLYRPTPLRRAYRLEAALGTPAKIFYKNESVSPAGSHKINTSIAQAYYNKMEGVNELSTETGAGQWGTALSIACAMFDMKCTVYMVRISFEQKPYRKSVMQAYGGRVVASPSMETDIGRKFNQDFPGTTGSLGMAISEAVEIAAKSGGSIKYSLGSVLNHVCMHQTIIGQEAKLQLESVGEYPDVVIGCCGGGSNFAGVAFPFVKDRLDGKSNVWCVAVEPAACPTLTRGPFAYDFGDTGGMTPLMKQYTLGHNFMPPGIHAGGLRYHGVATQVAHLKKEGCIGALALMQNPCFESSLLFAKCEGILPAPESSHAIRGAVEEALRCKEVGEAKTILFNLSGHGHFDLTAYDNYLSGNLQDIALDEESLRKGAESIPKINT
ncbi:MAG: TrpB-like pyridoxal phosphate-dependent enzyme [Candidatus Hydrogenedentes bacterium]|nr:TrpB-like pyridoxal phosphate-dependent enzyme [Candidatus Hydrogenedentota bacterium]